MGASVFAWGRRSLGLTGAVCVLCLPALAAAGTVSPLPRSDYGVQAVCATPGFHRAGCQSFRLVPRTAAARARRHPLGIRRSRPLAAPSPAEGAFGLRPQDLHTAYQLPDEAGSAQTVAIVDSYNDPNAEADLKVYQETFSLPTCTTSNGCFRQVNQKGETANLPFPKSVKELEAFRKGTRAQREEAEEAAGWGLEISLDIEAVHATCQSCRILLVEANSPSYENLEAAERSATSLGASEISNSWAGPETGETAEGESASPFDHAGTVIAASSGDNGYLNWDAPSGQKGGTNFPASSPHVVAVGGTRLTLGTGDAWAGETVWNGDHASGGGCSVVFTAQPWQQGVSDWTGVGCGTKRAVADVAADADPYTGLAVHDTSPECEYSYEEAKVKHVLYWCTIGGTSLSSPIIASVFALAGGAQGVAFPARTLYEGEQRTPGSLHDVATGSNGECTKAFTEEGLSGCTPGEEAEKSCASKWICRAGSGYDGPTGVGTPDGLGAFLIPSSAPTVATGSPSLITKGSAVLRGSVNPNGSEVTSCRLEYGTALPSGHSAPCSPSPGSGSSPVAVSGAVEGLQPATAYQYRVVATNAGGTSTGEAIGFTTLPNAPTVATGSASTVVQTSATLHASVDPNGGEVTSCTLEYGTALPSGHSVACSPPPGSGVSAIAVSASVSGLSPDTAYQYRVAATNAGGTSTGETSGFTTLPEPPAVTTEAATAITETSATLAGSVNPNGAEVSSCELEYGATTEYGSSAPCSPAPGSGESPVGVSASVAALAPGSTYHFRVTAANAGGTSRGADEVFTTVPAASYAYGTCADEVKVGGRLNGHYEDKNCIHADAAGEGRFEWTVASEGAQIGLLAKGKNVVLKSALMSVVCKKALGEGEITGPTSRTQALLLTGCSAAGQPCTTAGQAAGSIRTGTLEGSLAAPEAGGVWARYEGPAELTGFECAGVDYALHGTIAGVESCDVEVMAKKSCESFGEGEGEQELTLEVLGGAGEPAVLTAALTGKTAARLELRKL